MLKPINIRSFRVEPEARKQIFLSLFSLLYFSTIFLWQLPDSPGKDILIAPLRPFVYFWRLDQSWRLFTAPMYHENRHSLAIASFKDGIALAVAPGYVRNIDAWKRYRQERQLAFYNYLIADTGWKDWRTGAMRALLQDYRCVDNPIDSVSFNEFTSTISPPGTGPFTRENPKPQTEFKHLFHQGLEFGANR